MAPRGALRRLATGETSARRRIVGVLFGLSAVPAALAMGTAVDSYQGLSGGLLGLAVAAAGLVLLPTVAGMVVTAAMSLFAVLSFGGEVLHASPLGTGLLLFALGLAWTGVAMLLVVPSRQLGLAVGAGLALTGAQQLVVTNGAALWGYGLTFAVAVGCFLLYRWQRLVVLLVAGVLGDDPRGARGRQRLDQRRHGRRSGAAGGRRGARRDELAGTADSSYSPNELRFTQRGCFSGAVRRSGEATRSCYTRRSRGTRIRWFRSSAAQSLRKTGQSPLKRRVWAYS
jgi:hypothetical protein